MRQNRLTLIQLSDGISHLLLLLRERLLAKLLLLNDLLLMSQLKLVQVLLLANTRRLTHDVVHCMTVLHELRLNLVILLRVVNKLLVRLLDGVQVRANIHQLLYWWLRLLLIGEEVAQRRVWILELRIRSHLILEWLLLILHLLILQL